MQFLSGNDEYFDAHSPQIHDPKLTENPSLTRSTVEPLLSWISYGICVRLREVSVLEKFLKTLTSD